MHGQRACALAHLPLLPQQLQASLLFRLSRTFHPGPAVDQRNDVVIQSDTKSIDGGRYIAGGMIEIGGQLRVGQQAGRKQLRPLNPQLLALRFEIGIMPYRDDGHVRQIQTTVRAAIGHCPAIYMSIDIGGQIDALAQGGRVIGDAADNQKTNDSRQQRQTRAAVRQNELLHDGLAVKRNFYDFLQRWKCPKFDCQII